MRKLSDKEVAAVGKNGRITILDAETGEGKRRLRSHRELDIQAAEALSPQHVILALKKGVLRVVRLGAKGANSSFDIPGVPADDCRFMGLALLKGGVMPEVVVGDNQGWNSSIFVCKIDLYKQTAQGKRYGVNGFPECITTLPDRKVRFTQCQDGVSRNTVYTLDVETGERELRKQPDLNSLPSPKDGWVPDRITGKNLFVWKLSSNTLSHLRHGKDLGRVPHGKPELLVADIPGGFVSGFYNQLLARDDDGNVIEELLKDQTVHEVKYQDGLLTAISSWGKRKQISAWRVAAGDDEVKDEGGE
jgi:hypothetical protein